MAGLSASRDTAKMGGGALPPILSAKMPANTKIYQGSIVFIDANGRAVPATAAQNLTPGGIAVRDYDSTGLADDIMDCEMFQEIAKLDNGAGADACTAANNGKAVYALDDHTVSSVSTNRSQCGVQVKMDDDGSVWARVTLGGV